MSGGFLATLVGAVANATASPSIANPTAEATAPAPAGSSLEDRVAAAEAFMTTWGPILEQMASLASKL